MRNAAVRPGFTGFRARWRASQGAAAACRWRVRGVGGRKCERSNVCTSGASPHHRRALVRIRPRALVRIRPSAGPRAGQTAGWPAASDSPSRHAVSRGRCSLDGAPPLAVLTHRRSRSRRIPSARDDLHSTNVRYFATSLLLHFATSLLLCFSTSLLRYQNRRGKAAPRAPTAAARRHPDGCAQ